MMPRLILIIVCLSSSSSATPHRLSFLLYRSTPGSMPTDNRFPAGYSQARKRAHAAAVALVVLVLPGAPGLHARHDGLLQQAPVVGRDPLRHRVHRGPGQGSGQPLPLPCAGDCCDAHGSLLLLPGGVLRSRHGGLQEHDPPYGYLRARRQDGEKTRRADERTSCNFAPCWR